MQVKVLKLGHAAKAFHNIEPGSSIGSILAEAEFGTAGYSLSLNGLGASPEAELSDGDIATLVPKVEGGR
jgi:hypothetical protein